MAFLQLAPSSDEASQRWKLTALDTGFCKITSELLGEEIVLYQVDASNPEQLVVLMRAAEQNDVQQWKLSQIGMGGAIDESCSGWPF